MRMPSAPTFTIAAGLAAMALAFFSNAGAQDQTLAETAPKRLSSAIFAGGCFWCVESDFDKVDGVIDTVSGYTGGEIANPTYKQVSKENTGHYEAVKVTYDPDLVSYDTLVEYFSGTWIPQIPMVSSATRATVIVPRSSSTLMTSARWLKPRLPRSRRQAC